MTKPFPKQGLPEKPCEDTNIFRSWSILFAGRLPATKLTKGYVSEGAARQVVQHSNEQHQEFPNTSTSQIPRLSSNSLNRTREPRPSNSGKAKPCPGKPGAVDPKPLSCDPLNRPQQPGKTEFPLSSIYPKSVIRHAKSVSDWGNEAFGHLARFCPHPVSRYAST